MKKIILLLVIMVFNFGYSQIKPLETTSIKSIGKIPFIEINQNNDLITCTYDDPFSKTVNSFSFKNENNDLANLYSAIISGFENVPASDIALELPNDILYLHFEKSMGVVNFQFKQAAGKDLSNISKSIYLTKKKVNKLFGKE